MPNTDDRQPAFMSHEVREEAAGNIAAIQALTRGDMLRLGFLKVEDLSDEEVVAGRPRELDEDINKPMRQQNARTRKTQILPPDIYDAMIAEHNKRTNERLRQTLDRALDTMVEVMDDTTAEPSDRFKAAQYLFERVAGKTPDKLTVKVERQPWEEVFEGIALTSRQQSRFVRTSDNQPVDAEGRPIIDATVVPDAYSEPEPVPYGHIQTPKNPDDPDHSDENPDDLSNPGREVPDGEARQAAWASEDTAGPPTPLPRNRPGYTEHGFPGMETGKGYPQQVTGDVYETPTVPPTTYVPPAHVNTRAPDMRHPVNTSSTAPPAGYTYAEAQAQAGAVWNSEQQVEASKPLSQRLSDNAQRSAELAALRKAAVGGRKDAKKARADLAPERGKAAKRRIVYRAMGVDAQEKLNIQATESDDRVKFVAE